MALETHQLACSYAGKTIFDRVNLSLFAGQFAALVGPSGAGKTTLLKSLLGAIPCQQGAITIGGRAVEFGRVAGAVGYVPQVETIDWAFPVTAAEVVMMGCYRPGRFLPWPSASDRRVAQQLLERMGVADVARHHIGALSGGQLKRVFLARALVGEPELVFLDEPAAGLDLKAQHEILHLLADLNRQGLTILMSTHDLNLVATHLPWVICFNHGVICQGPPDRVLNPATLEATFGAEMIVIRDGDRVVIANKLLSLRHKLQQNSQRLDALRRQSLSVP
ncbi:metal ABC transporter ATP-binding protein [Synechococcus sp. PCC 7336]|uniref:metal ABC transporter ATP-binding protein n=1 Tax=Synechococcus sp. PCC 7336 TaxID=195250 RepID=UPI000684F51B|nr:ABC transporter ATP-binding protein [Synechococcus sp. PCC 7336]